MASLQTHHTFDFQKLSVYQKAQLFYLGCKQIQKNITTERYIQDQLSRAAYSIVLNIAEGSGRFTPADRRNFFTISRASVFECVAILDLLYIEKHIDQPTHKQHMQLACEISKMLYVMISNLKDAGKKGVTN
jgi:four helix bundle protein